MLGLEQKPSPHALRQIAANRNMKLGQKKQKHKNVLSQVQDKIMVQHSRSCSWVCFLEKEFNRCNLGYDLDLILYPHLQYFKNPNRPQSKNDPNVPFRHHRSYVMEALLAPSHGAIFFFEFCCHKRVPVCVFSLLSHISSLSHRLLLACSAGPSSHQVESSH